MLSAFLLFRAATFALFIACNTIICSVAAWNLGFARSSDDLATLAQIDSFLIFVGVLGLLIVFPVIFIEVFRRGAISSRVWFELVWLTLSWIFNFSGAAAVTAVAPSKMCSFNSDMSHSSGSACTSARVLIVFSWLNTGFLFMYFFSLTTFAIMHQNEDASVWRATVCDFPWFATRQCIRSAPASPVMSRFAKSKSPSLIVPKPRRAPPQPLFIHGRAGLGSRVDIEHFTDVGSLESQPLPAPSLHVAAPPAAALSFYPQHVQTTMQVPTTYQSNSYSSADRGASPPPIRNWPRPIGSEAPGERTLSERARQKQRALPELRRSDSDASSSSQRTGQMRAPPPPPPPLALERTPTKESAAPSSGQTSPSRNRPTGPRTRTRSGSSTFVRPRPPPLDLTREGATPNNRR